MANNLFYGVELSIPVQDRLSGLIESIKNTVPRATWTPSDKLHLTLHFVGKAGDDEEEDATLALGVVEQDAFDIHVRGVGQFDAGRVLWAGVKVVNDNDTFSPFDLIRNRLGAKGRFSAHVTLGKLERRGDKAAEFLDLARSLKDYDFGISKVTSIKLYKTVGEGKPYEVIAWKALD